ncbi:SDR family oxidoreductase [bacterium SCSIO 12741]|nr:SDR family oxidoreductase [bacterium SCSIO 12741]
MILVTGATGGYGGSAIQHLLNKGVPAQEIIALVRSEEKAKDLKEKGIEIRVGDYTDYNSLVQAFKGVDKLLFVSGNDIPNRDDQHKNVVDAAKETGVKHVVYTSFYRRPEIENSAIAFLQDTHIKTENWLKESGIAYTLLQNALYMDMVTGFAGEKVLETGLISLPGGSGKFSAVIRDELAEAAAQILTTEGHEHKAYPLTNKEALSMPEMAEAISKASGTSVSYKPLSNDEYQKEMESQGVPALFIGIFQAFAKAQAQGELDIVGDTLESLIGRKPYSAQEFIEKVYG